LVLFFSGAIWLIIASVFGMIASIKFHSPAFLADSPWLTYGRVRPAFSTSLVYGFLLQAGLGVSLWVFARLGRTLLAGVPIVIAGALLLNAGAATGVVGILAGDASGFESFELPSYAAPLILAGAFALAICGALTFHNRTVRAPLYVTQWFLLAALLWFLWIFSTVFLLVDWSAARGVTQAVAVWWYAGNLQNAWLGLTGVGLLFYFLPKLAGRELHSRHLALFTFWAILFSASWTGLPVTAPVPAWMVTSSKIGSMLMLLVLITVWLNLIPTLSGKWSLACREHPSFKFFAAALVLYLLLVAVEIVSVASPLSEVVAFTWFVPAKSLANLYGFGGLVLLGAVYYIAPRLFQGAWPFPKLVNVHFWLAVIGLVLWLGPQFVGGISQGLKLRDPDVAFLGIAQASLHFLRISTVGELLVALGHVLLLLNLSSLAYRFYRERARVACADALQDLRLPREVRA
jgi:cytochrome c oxidase cbb3-type subunit 1